MKISRSIVLAAALLVAEFALADYLNPCGIVQGDDAWFRIDFGRLSPPDSEIEWMSSGEGTVSFPEGNRGRTVRVRGGACGAVKLEVQIGDATSRRPCFHARVVTNSVVGVSAWVIGDGEAPASSGERVVEMLGRANEIWKQTGLSFRLDEYCVTNRADMMDVGYTSANGAPTVYDVAALNPASGILKVYFVNTIAGGTANVVVNGTTTRKGILISACATTSTLAHEIGHAFGLKDVYVSYQGIAQSAHGPLSESKTPDDWNGGTGQRYYTPGTGIESLIPKLLMYGGGGDSRADITIGGVYGLWYSNRWNAATHRFERVWQTSLAPVGYFRSGSNIPQYGHEEQQGGIEMDRKSAALAAIAGVGLGVGAEIVPPYADEIDVPPELCCNAPECERTDPISDEEAIKVLEETIGYEHDLGVVDGLFRRMGCDKERMTRILIHSAQDAYDRKYDMWNRVALRSIGSLAACGTDAAMPFLEGVLTNDVYGAGGWAAEAYVRLSGDGGRDFAFFKENFGAGRIVPRDIGKVIYRVVGDRLRDANLPEGKRQEYVAYLLARAECEHDSVTGNLLDKTLVETLSGYRESERRKANLDGVQKATLKPVRIRRTETEPTGR